MRVVLGPCQCLRWPAVGRCYDGLGLGLWEGVKRRRKRGGGTSQLKQGCPRLPRNKEYDGNSPQVQSARRLRGSDALFVFQVRRGLGQSFSEHLASSTFRDSVTALCSRMVCI